jgi:hypothetical protein
VALGVKIGEGTAVLGCNGVWVGIEGSVGVICAGAAEIGGRRVGAHPVVKIKIIIVMYRNAFMIASL